MGDFKVLQKSVHATAKNNGWWDPPLRGVPELLCLIHSEVSEALEAYRNEDRDNFEEELADIVIRVMDMAEYFRIDLTQKIIDKDAVNRTRGHKHGGKLC